MIKTVIRAFGYGRTSQELSDRELNTALKHPIVDGKKVAQATPVVATVVTPSSPPRPQPPSPLTRFNQNTIDERIVIPPHQILSDYDLVKIVGESKTATITLAIHRPTQEKVAIKRYQKSERSTHIYREASIHAKAHHPQIAQLRAFAEGERDIFLVQEYIAGGELFDAVTPDVGCKPEHFRSYALQLCQAVSYLHSKNIAHRDLKPENVMLSGDQKTLKVIDFGLSEYCVDNVKYKQHIGTVCGIFACSLSFSRLTSACFLLYFTFASWHL
jgi:serine/threonine protein kinase